MSNTPGRRTVWRWVAASATLAISTPAFAASARSMARQVEAIYQPFRVEQAALAPDGRHVAFVVREGRGIEVQIFEVDRPVVRKRVALDSRAAAQSQFLAWTGADQVVMASGQPLIVAIDANSGVGRSVVDTKTFAAPEGRRPAVRVLGLVADDPDGLMLEVSRFLQPREIQLGVVRVNLRTGALQEIHTTELEQPGGSILIDRQGAPRVLFSRTGIPQRFSHRPSTAGNHRWQRLDSLVEAGAPLGFEVTPGNFTGQRSIPLGFGYDPEILYFASNVGRDTHGIYALDLRTGRRTGWAQEDPEFDLVDLNSPWSNSPLVFDRGSRALAGVRRIGLEAATRWLDAEIGDVQSAIEQKFPDRTVQLLEWDGSRERFLALVSSHGDPGRYFVYHRANGRCVEFLRRAPGLAPESLSRSEPFAFVTPSGERLSGYITWPQSPTVAKPALLVWLHDGPWQRIAPGFHREAQALAAMGFAVAQIDYRGSAGHGRQWRESLRGRFDTAPLEDVLAAVAWLEERHAFDRRRVALVGEGYGGYLALRGLQRQPGAFRSAVSINAPVELGDLRRSLENERRIRRELEREVLGASPLQFLQEGRPDGEARMAAAMNAPAPAVDFELELRRWFFGGQGDLSAISVVRNAGLITKPVMLLHDRTQRHAPIAPVQELRDALARRKQTVVFGEISPQFARGVPGARAQVMRRVGEFFNVTLYDFDVQIGEVTEKK